MFNLQNYLFGGNDVFATILGRPTRNGAVRIYEKTVMLRDQNGQVVLNQNGQPTPKLNKNGQQQSIFSMALAVQTPGNMNTLYCWGRTVVQSNSKMANLYRSFAGRNVRAHVRLVPNQNTDLNSDNIVVNIESIELVRQNNNYNNNYRQNYGYAQQNGYNNYNNNYNSPAYTNSYTNQYPQYGQQQQGNYGYQSQPQQPVYNNYNQGSQQSSYNQQSVNNMQQPQNQVQQPTFNGQHVYGEGYVPQQTPAQNNIAPQSNTNNAPVSSQQSQQQNQLVSDNQNSSAFDNSGLTGQDVDIPDDEMPF